MEKYLSWFLGPKSENSIVFEDLIKLIVKDYLHWRKNYFPQDELLLSPADTRGFINEQDILYKSVNEFLAQMRRNFPFYNPRYIGHMLSDTSIPSILGYFGGMLYNPNNVTTEAAPVTTEWEIESCNDIAKMIGYKIAPATNSKGFRTYDELLEYKKKLADEFSWTHIASGGTLANIEALWVARNVKYLPISIKEACIKRNFSINVKCASGQCLDIKDIDGYTLINVKTNESIYLLSKYISAYIKHSPSKNDTQRMAEEAIDYLSKQEHSISNGLGKLLIDYPLSIYVSGSAHYSWNKAADLLGIGVNNIINVLMSPAFRLDCGDLKRQIIKNTRNTKNSPRCSPLAVIGILGTTEEGAVDPIDKIDDLRKELEKDYNISFWLHVDAAWGGYVKSIIRLTEADECKLLVNKVLYLLSGKKSSYFNKINTSINDSIVDSINEIKVRTLTLIDKANTEEIINKDWLSTFKDEIKDLTFYNKNVDGIRAYFMDVIRKHIRTNKTNSNQELLVLLFEILKESYVIEKLIVKNNYIEAKEFIYRLGKYALGLNNNQPKDLIEQEKSNNKFQITLEDRARDLANYTNSYVTMSYLNFSTKGSVRIDNSDLVAALLATDRADSVTIDPHKMGYLPYPCGIISFKNDRVRHFITQKAPYITSAKHNALLHNPPRHYKDINFDEIDRDTIPSKLTIATDAFASFILEGSKPGASAASLWMANKCISLDRSGHGQIVKNSLMATQILHKWICNWNRLMTLAKEPIKYKILPVSPEKPDLNLLVFTVLPLCENMDLKSANEFICKVYDKYSIQAELGDDKYSYAQPFFISKTECKSNAYKYQMFKDFFKSAGINTTQREYNKYGFTMLRATLMNPYIYPYIMDRNVDFIGLFMSSLHETTMEIINNP
jgi:glutamate/tyrosine decarboxylase-like PLP-dependent enzyme